MHKGQNLSVFDEGLTTVTTIPMRDVVGSIPQAVKRPHLCLVVNCPQTNCRRVHVRAAADRSAWKHQAIHANFSVRTPEATKYPRLLAGNVLCVASPNFRPPHFTLQSETILLTKGAVDYLNTPVGERLEGEASPLQHCAHFFFNKVCNLGPNCAFVHAMHVDESTTGEHFAPTMHVARSSRDGGPPESKPQAAESQKGCPTEVPLPHSAVGVGRLPLADPPALGVPPSSIVVGGEIPSCQPPFIPLAGQQQQQQQQQQPQPVYQMVYMGGEQPQQPQLQQQLMVAVPQQMYSLDRQPQQQQQPPMPVLQQQPQYQLPPFQTAPQLYQHQVVAQPSMQQVQQLVPPPQQQQQAVPLAPLLAAPFQLPELLRPTQAVVVW